MVWVEIWQWGGADTEAEVTVAKHGVGGAGSEELRPVTKQCPELPASCGTVSTYPKLGGGCWALQ